MGPSRTYLVVRRRLDEVHEVFGEGETVEDADQNAMANIVQMLRARQVLQQVPNPVGSEGSGNTRRVVDAILVTRRTMRMNTRPTTTLERALSTDTSSDTSSETTTETSSSDDDLPRAPPTVNVPQVIDLEAENELNVYRANGAY